MLRCFRMKHPIRQWTANHSKSLNFIYNTLERVLLFLNPLIQFIGYDRLERPFAFTERQIKGFLFDCKMCGQCALSSTGMVCPMNCPKQLRNGPCGGVLGNGNCEVITDMKCVWVQGYEGAVNMPGGVDRMREYSFPIDHRLFGRSSWLSAIRGK